MSTELLIFPGGAYRRLVVDESVVEWGESLGMAAHIVEYPTATRHPAPLDAARNAMRAARDRGADHVGVLGFSAGGHLAGLLALTSVGDERPDFVVLAQPVVSLQMATTLPYPTILLGPAPSEDDLAALSLDRRVDAGCPPFFVWHSSADDVVSPEHSYRLACALQRRGASHALHIFSTGAHGIRMAWDEPEASVWRELCAQWMRLGGWIHSR